jgi:hypothetical protein
VSPAAQTANSRTINRVFVVAMAVAVVYFGGELLVRTFTLPLSVLRVGSALVPFLFAPALPLRLLVPGLSLTTYLIAACLGWGVLVELLVAIRQRRASSARHGP